jgi:hypothetical protein
VPTSEIDADRRLARELAKERAHAEEMYRRWKELVVHAEALQSTIEAQGARIQYLKNALELIGGGLICPELFPDVKRTEEDYELAAKTAMVTAIAALEHE